MSHSIKKWVTLVIFLKCNSLLREPWVLSFIWILCNIHLGMGGKKPQCTSDFTLWCQQSPSAENYTNWSGTALRNEASKHPPLSNWFFLFWLYLHFRLSVMDLVVAMAPCVDEVTMTKTFELIRPYLEVRALVVSNLNPSNLSSILVNCVSVGVFFKNWFISFSDKRAKHAEEGVPCARGDVWRRERCMFVVCHVQSGNTQSRAAWDSEKRLFTCKKGACAVLKRSKINETPKGTLYFGLYCCLIFIFLFVLLFHSRDLSVWATS